MGGGGKNVNNKNLQISKNRPTIWKKILNESKTEDLSPSNADKNFFYSCQQHN